MATLKFPGLAGRLLISCTSILRITNLMVVPYPGSTIPSFNTPMMQNSITEFLQPAVPPLSLQGGTMAQNQLVVALAQGIAIAEGFEGRLPDGSFHHPSNGPSTGPNLITLAIFSTTAPPYIMQVFRMGGMPFMHN